MFCKVVRVFAVTGPAKAAGERPVSPSNHRRVRRDDDACEACGFHPSDDLGQPGSVTTDVELEEVSTRGRGGERFPGFGYEHSAHARGAGGGRCASTSQRTIFVIQRHRSDRGQHHRYRQRNPDERTRGVDGSDVGEHLGHECEIGKALPVSRRGDLLARSRVSPGEGAWLDPFSSKGDDLVDRDQVDELVGHGCSTRTWRFSSTERTIASQSRIDLNPSAPVARGRSPASTALANCETQS